LGAVLVFRDVSEQRRLNNEMSRRAKHDALTGLINRAEFEARLSHLLAKSHREGLVHALLFIDLDRFKQVNDACGHSSGDLLLQQFAKLLKDAVRAGDTVARLGGDEFAILLEDCVEERAQEVGGQICNRMDEFRFVHQGQSFRLGTSIGLVEIGTHWADTAAIVHAADAACYAAKAAGRNRVYVWEDSQQVRQSRHGDDQWGKRLELALQNDGFVLYAQRIVPVGTWSDNGGLCCEVLLRLVDADGSLILPGAFLPAAERFHLAARLDLWVVRQVLAWLCKPTPRPEPGQLPPSLISINLSAHSVSDQVFHRDLNALIRASGADITKLCFEISEGVAVTNQADFIALCAPLRAQGASVALDDVGSSAASLGYLKNLPVDWLKVDGKYLRGIAADAINRITVRGFCDVAQVLGLKTVAKSVEPLPAPVPSVPWADLQALGIHCVQGYGVHHPQPLATLLVDAGDHLVSSALTGFV
jgi:diguanylate cyclase (GGDEF)-like protein